MATPLLTGTLGMGRAEEHPKWAGYMRSQRTLEVGSGEVVEPNSEPVGSVIGIALAESQGNVRENRGYRG